MEESSTQQVGQRRRLQILENAILIVVYIIVCLTLTLPTVFYFIPKPEATSENIQGQPILPIMEPKLPQSCPGVDPFLSVCQDVFAVYSSCRSSLPVDPSAQVTISPLASQPGAFDEFAVSFGCALANSNTTSGDCAMLLLPFMCTIYYSYCADDTLFLPSQQVCTIVSSACGSDWDMANMLFPGVLPDCSTLPTSTDEFVLHGCLIAAVQSIPPRSSNVACPNCSQDFYRDEISGTCIPDCNEFHLFDNTTIVASAAFLIAACAIGLLAGIAIMVISVLRRKSLLVYPSSLIVYGSITATVFDVFMIIGFIGGDDLFCSSRSFLASVVNESAYCDIAGAVGWYVQLQLTLWWACHVSALYMAIRFPFYTRRLQATTKIHVIHVTAIILCILLPFIPVIAALATDGYTHFRNLSPLCTPQDSRVTLYCSVIPTSILIAIGIPMMIRCLYIILKEHSLFKVAHEQHKRRVAQIKVIILLCYYILVVIIFLIVFCALFYDINIYQKEVEEYFKCELLGSDPERQCDRSSYERFSFPVMFIVALMLMGVFPAVNLVYAISVNEVRTLFRRCIHGKQDPTTSYISSYNGKYRQRTTSVLSPSPPADAMTGTMSLPPVQVGSIKQNGLSSDIDTKVENGNGVNTNGVKKGADENSVLQSSVDSKEGFVDRQLVTDL